MTKEEIEACHVFLSMAEPYLDPVTKETNLAKCTAALEENNLEKFLSVVTGWLLLCAERRYFEGKADCLLAILNKLLEEERLSPGGLCFDQRHQLLLDSFKGIVNAFDHRGLLSFNLRQEIADWDVLWSRAGLNKGCLLDILDHYVKRVRNAQYGFI